MESFLEGHVRAFEWLGGVPRECVYDNLRSAVARRERSGDREVTVERAGPAAARPLRLPRACLHAGDTAREGVGRRSGSAYLKTGFWPARRFSDLIELDAVYADWRDRIALPRRHATGRHVVWERLAHEREQLRRLPPIGFDAAGRRSRGFLPTAT